MKIHYLGFYKHKEKKINVDIKEKEEWETRYIHRE